jgi:hypothetical protein
MWDNRPKKESGEWKATSPDFKCKDEECAHVIWPDKGAKPKVKGDAKSHPTRQKQPTVHQMAQAEYDKLQSHTGMTGEKMAKYHGFTKADANKAAFLDTWYRCYGTGADKRNVIPVQEKPKDEVYEGTEDMPEALEDDEPDLPF